ncbi:DMT family transporter [Mesorhizobium tamadayense]|uniref:DMT family transporter n=1 Tax=Mesorhizobium tamadayense TaxID=425306 RepID=A0A3P3F5X5_9HYPH|nr:DMT family transporter [Mesorhizobium tamadayense]
MITAHSVALLVPVMWGLYWIPARYVEASTGTGVWGTVYVVIVACVVLAPAAWRYRTSLYSSNCYALISTGLGGASFALYAAGLLYGSVAVVVVLYYLTPVWSVLIARLWLKQETSLTRYAAIVIGMVGIFLVLKGNNTGIPLPQEVGDWLGLGGGILWSIASTGIYIHSRLDSYSSNFVFSVGAFLSAVLLACVMAAPSLETGHSIDYGTGIPAIIIIGVGWWAVALTGFLWAARLLEPTRLGIFMMTEVAAGAVSAALFAGEPYGVLMLVGTVLVIVAGLMAAASPSTPLAADNCRY